MKKLVFLTLALSFFFATFVQAQAECQVKYTGIYKADLNEDEAIYLRFFKDGTVLHTSSITDEKKAYKFLIQQFSDQMLSGKFYQRGCSFSADVKHAKIKLAVKGAVQGDILLVSMKDKVTGETLDKQFEYFEMEEELEE
jgi:hypothetical protein